MVLYMEPLGMDLGLTVRVFLANLPGKGLGFGDLEKKIPIQGRQSAVVRPCAPLLLLLQKQIVAGGLVQQRSPR